MADLVVTVPKPLWLDWILEGDAAGETPSGEEWGFFLGGSRPQIEPGERLYIVAWGFLRGWAPVTRVASTDRGWVICRRGGAVACTVDGGGTACPARIDGFRGTLQRWWPREIERPFPDWMTAGLPQKLTLDMQESMEDIDYLQRQLELDGGVA